MSQIKVLVVDDHPLFRRGLVEMLSEEPDIQVVGEAENGLEAIQKVASLVPDVVFMDLNMPEQGGIETTAYLAQRWPQMKVLILTVSEDSDNLFQAMGVGAVGYVLKMAGPREILDALRQVWEGWVVICPAMAPRLLADLQTMEADPTPTPTTARVAGETRLTPRELEILEGVTKSLSNIEIANAMTVSENTVKTHLKNILAKLHVRNRREAAQYAGRLGLLASDPGGGLPQGA